jgi:hypothetical protein
MNRMNHQMPLCLLAVLAAAQTLVSAPQKPRWSEPECPGRAAFSTGRLTAQTLLVDIPLEGGEEGLEPLSARDAYGRPMPFRLVHAAPGRASVLVQPSARKTGIAGYVYYGKPGATGGERPAASKLTDPKPLRAEVRKARGLGIPDTWPRMLHMFHGSGKAYRVTWEDRFGEIELARDTDSEKVRKVWRIGRYLTRLSTYVLFPEDGVYRLAVNCKNAGFVLLDGELAAAWPGEHYYGSWHPGAPVYAKAGVHKLEVFNCTVGYPYIHVGWQPPGSEKVTHIPRSALLTGQEAASVRVERQDRSLHPHFTYDFQPAYAFRNHTAVFVPVAFTNTSQDWVSPEMSCRWTFGDSGTGEGSGITHVFKGTAKHRVRLDVRDSLGYEGTYERVVDCRLLRPTEYALSAEPTSLPAVAYASDMIAPCIDIAGRLSDERRVRLEWTVVRRDGSEEAGYRELVPTNQVASVRVTRALAGELDRLRWAVTHEGVDILSGQVRFLRAPFEEKPVDVRGDGLCDRNGARLVLIPYEHAGVFAQPGAEDETLRYIQCIDDSLAVPGLPYADEKSVFHRVLLREIPGREVPRVQYIPLPPWQHEQGGHAPLVRIMRIVEAVSPKADVAVLSVGLQDILGAGGVAAFERQAAAISDLVAGALGCRVLWVTPPPYRPDPAVARPFAAALKKVAYARGMPVADLFTAFSGSDDDPSVFFERDTVTLSKHGHDLTAHVILRALQE